MKQCALVIQLDQQTIVLFMCTTYNGTTYDRPFHKNDRAHLVKLYPVDLVEAVIPALMDNHHPKLGVFIVILDMADRWRKKQYRTGTRMVTLPFSAQEFDTMIRFQSKAMYYVHELMLSFALSTRNLNLLNQALERFGMKMGFFCDCGCAMIGADDVWDQTIYTSTNLYRGFAESVGTEVESCDSYEQIIGVTDMIHTDWDAHERILNQLKTFPKENEPTPECVKTAQDEVRKQTVLDLINHLVHTPGTLFFPEQLRGLVRELLDHPDVCRRHRSLVELTFDESSGEMTVCPRQLVPSA